LDKHDVRKGVEIEFGDELTRTIKPLSIKQLRKFVKVIEKMGNTQDATSMSDSDIDNMVEAASIILEKVDPSLSADREKVEDVVDVVTFNEMMGIAMGASSPEE
jgi:hypothetical protein